MAMIPAGRRLKVLEHKVHKIEIHEKENGEVEEEQVVSNLRPFTLKVGVTDHLDRPVLDSSVPLRATLLYENGLPVQQASSSEPLIVGETSVVALHGTATFKLRITSLSSHRDKQRFRIQVEPQDAEVALQEPHLIVVTQPMKSVTKLGRATPGSAQSGPAPAALGEANGGAHPDSMKRKYRDVLEEHAAQLRAITDTQATIMGELHAVAELAAKARRLGVLPVNLGAAARETAPAAS
jgi:hypothetical protein